ncbi:hypothetical protein [Nocardia sp. NPDC004711]
MSPAAELRRMGVSLVDPGEEVKPAVDDLLRDYQDRLRVGNTRMTAAARAELDDASVSSEMRSTRASHS